jgi:type I restriction enzyme R subunit
LEAQQKVAKREGGIIWHTQGSGKSLTMVWLSKWILLHYSNARVLIITDRDELDEQIEKTYGGVDETIYRTKSCKDLIVKIGKFEDDDFTIRFQEVEEGNVRQRNFVSMTTNCNFGITVLYRKA